MCVYGRVTRELNPNLPTCLDRWGVRRTPWLLVWMKGLEPSATGPPDRCSTKLSYIQINGRRRGIRTPIQAPKASVLPLHYVLYIAEIRSAVRWTGAAALKWCWGRDSDPRFPNYQFGALPTWPPQHKTRLTFFLKEAGIQPAIFPWKGNVLALDYSSKRSLL